MAYIVVIRREGQTTPARIYRGENPGKLFRRVMERIEPTFPPKRTWSEEDDLIIETHYNSVSAAKIGKMLSRPANKNMVIGRAKRLGLCRSMGR